MRPNVLLVVCDTARADAFEPYGGPPGSTPVVADLARRGVASKGVHSTANWTLPSHASMFTGLLPRPLGLRAGGAGLRLEDHADRVLAEVLRREGYSTAGITANPMLHRKLFGFGFDEYRVIRGGRKHAPGMGLRNRLRWARDAALARIDDGLDEVDRTVRGWLDAGTGGQPFFWFVNLMECHSPYLPPKPYNPLGPVARVRAGEDARRYLSHDGIARYCLGELDASPATLERMRRLYRASIRMMDEWIGRTVAELDRRGLLDDTLVLITSDHGENFGEGHLLAHGFSLDDRLLRVPFIAVGPGAASLAGTEVASLASLPALVASAVGMRRHPWTDDLFPAGIVVAQNDGMRALGPIDTTPLTGDMPDAAVETMGRRLTAASDGRFKLVLYGDDERLFDLADDPLESTDVAAAHPAEVARLRGAMAAAEGGPVAPRRVEDSTSPLDAEEADLEERMRLLGYL